MKYIKVVILLLLSIYSICSNGQVLPLDTILFRIENNNSMLKMYDEQIAATNNYSQMAKSWMPPTISSGLWQTPYKNPGDGMWMISTEQMIPNPVKQKTNYNYMVGMAAVEQKGKEAKRNEFFSIAKEDYYNWVVLQKKYAILIETDSLLNYILKVSQLRYTYHKEKITNIYKAQAVLYELRNMETMTQSDMEMKNIEINVLMNENRAAVYDIDTTLPTHHYELQLTDTALLSSARSDIKQLDENINLLRLREQNEKSKRLPDFGISLSHMQSLGNMPNQFSAMGMFTLPIAPWASKEYRSTVKSTEHMTNSMTLEKQSLLNESAGMIAALRTQIKSAKQQLANYTINIVPAYYKSYQTSLIAYEQNTEDLFTVLESLKMLRMAEINELDQLNLLLKLQVNYEKEMEIR